MKATAITHTYKAEPYRHYPNITHVEGVGVAMLRLSREVEASLDRASCESLRVLLEEALEGWK